MTGSMSVAITSQDELTEWLEHKPREWALVIAVRAALRVLPIALDPEEYIDGIVRSRFALTVFRAIAISSGASTIPTDDIAAAYAASAADTYAAAAADTYPASTSGARAGAAAESASAAAYATAFACASANAAYGVANAAALAVAHAADAAGYTNAAADAFAADSAAAAASVAIWQSISNDLSALENGIGLNELFSQPLWQERPDWFDQSWDNAKRWMSRNKDGFQIWREWYLGRLEGTAHTFAGFDQEAEREFFTRLFAQDDDWWDREPAEVNRDIAGWVEELRKTKDSVGFFISYASENEAAAREVAEVLDELGKSYLVQYRDFAQQNFVNAMNDAMRRSSRLIALYSPDYIGSDHCNAEWNYFYNRDPSSAQRRILAFKLESGDLKPLMEQIVYRDLSTLRMAERKDAIREWIGWEPPNATRESVVNAVTANLSPRIVENEPGQLDTGPDPVFDKPEYPAELARALGALRMILNLVREDSNNLPTMMQRSLSHYDEEFTRGGANSSWGGLDRLISIITDGLANVSGEEFSPGQKKALEELIAAHKECMASLKNADIQKRDLAAIPVKAADREAIDDLVSKLKDFFAQLSNLGATSERLDKHVDDLIEQGRDFAFDAGVPDADQKPQNAKRRYLLYIGGVGIAALHAAGSMASISSAPAAQQIITAGQQLVEAFFRIVGL
jgi:hypothetical protein